MNRHLKLSAFLLAVGLSAAAFSQNLRAAYVSGIVEIARLTMPRAGHTASLLSDGRVLIAGGCVSTGCEGGLTATTEFFDPHQQRFLAGPNMRVARVGQVAVSLPSGDVLIFGGWSGRDATEQAERFNARQNRFENAGSMLEGRDGFTATLLLDGRVLIVGGYKLRKGRMVRLASAELYDPSNGRFSAASSMGVPRMAHSAALLQDGRVLIAGGNQGTSDVLSSAEIFDPKSERFTTTGSMTVARHKHAAVTLEDGTVLVLGGSDANDFEGQRSSSERFDPVSGAFRLDSSMRAPRFKIPNAVALLEGNAVLVAGSDRLTEIYDAMKNAFRTLDGSIESELSYSTVTPLADGRALIAGGYDPTIHISSHTWLYRP